MRLELDEDRPGNRKQKGMPKGMALSPDVADVNHELNILKQKFRAWRRMCPIREWRLGNQLTMEAAAAALQINYKTLLNWESGQRYPREAIYLVDSGGKRAGKVYWDEHITPLTGVTYKSMDDWVRKNPMHGAAKILKKVLK